MPGASLSKLSHRIAGNQLIFQGFAKYPAKRDQIQVYRSCGNAREKPLVACRRNHCRRDQIDPHAPEGSLPPAQPMSIFSHSARFLLCCGDREASVSELRKSRLAPACRQITFSCLAALLLRGEFRFAKVFRFQGNAPRRGRTAFLDLQVVAPSSLPEPAKGLAIRISDFDE